MPDVQEGRKIFLEQLKEMARNYKKIEECLLDDDFPRARAEAFCVPEDLREAFYAYHAEFLTDHGKSTNLSGPFFNDEDIKDGIWSKFWHFYWPIVKLLENNYQNLRFTLIIAPEYQDCSTVLVIAENGYGQDILPFPVVVNWECVKAWCMPFDDPGVPESVYAQLSTIYDRMDEQTRKAIQHLNL